MTVMTRSEYRGTKDYLGFKNMLINIIGAFITRRAWELPLGFVIMAAKFYNE